MILKYYIFQKDHPMAIGGTIQTKVGIVEFRLTLRLVASDINIAGDSLCEDHSV